MKKNKFSMKKFFLLFKFLLKLIVSSKKKNSLKLKNIYCDKIFIKSNKINIFKSISITESIKFNKNSNKLNSLIEGDFIIQNKITKNKKINILLIAFSNELYIAEFFLKLGYDLNVYFYDLKIEKNKLNPEILNKIQSTFIEDDIRNFNKYFDKSYFDFIFLSRGGIERFHYLEFIKILNELRKILSKEESLILTHVNNIFFYTRHLIEAEKRDISISKNIDNEKLTNENRDYDYLNLYCSNLHNNEEDYLKDIKNYLKIFNREIKTTWLLKFINKQKLNKDDISAISASHTKNYSRLKEIQEVSNSAELFSTYFHSNKNEKLYICSYIKIKKN